MNGHIIKVVTSLVLLCWKKWEGGAVLSPSSDAPLIYYADIDSMIIIAPRSGLFDSGWHAPGHK